jgi:hypothetical protein
MFRTFARLALVVGGVLTCAVIFLSWAYTADRKWTPGQLAGERGISFEADLPAALRECVAAHDHERLPDLAQEREYRISGWFIDERRTAPVIQCMRKKGWLAVPTTLYSP